MVVKRQWVDCNIPWQVAEAIDQYLQTDSAARTGVHSRSDFITRLCVSWFSNVAPEFSIFDSRLIAEQFKRTHPAPPLPPPIRTMMDYIRLQDTQEKRLMAIELFQKALDIMIDRVKREGLI